MLIRTNAKLSKSFGPAADYLIGGLTLAPHSLSGDNVCEFSSIGCRAACNLWFAGQRVTPQARARAIADTRLFFDDRDAFLSQLHHDIVSHAKRAERGGLLPLIRLNVASDLDWSAVIAQHPSIQFYDYTKSVKRFRSYLDGKLPSNYVLTFSASEKRQDAVIAGFLSSGGNVAQVFDVDYYPAVGRVGAMPTWHDIGDWSYPVIDADLHDVRLPEIDGRGVVCGLRLKGTNAAKSRARHSGFAAEGVHYE